jgi:hypothetical protein
MSYLKFISTNLDISDIHYGVSQNGFVTINLDNSMDYSINDVEIIDTLLKKYKKLWLCGEWRTYNIPDYITHLCFDIYKMHKPGEVMNKLPASLEFLSILIDSFNEPLTNLPPNLKHLEINFGPACDYGAYNKSLDFLPIGLETLVLVRINNDYVIENIIFPPKLKILVIDFEFIPTNIPTLYNLPTTLEYLYIRSSDNGFQQGIKDYIPNVNIIYH